MSSFPSMIWCYWFGVRMLPGR